MQFLTTTASLIAILASSVLADNCLQGFDYCGSSLLKKGDYWDQINQALTIEGHPNWSGKNVLFTCLGGEGGAIEFLEACPGGCSDNGEGNSDSCY